MKYTQYSSKKRGNSAFYIILAVCLSVIGIAAWFAFSKMADTPSDMTSEKENSSIQNNSEYNSNNSSYNENSDNNIITPPQSAIPSTPTAQEPEDIPYSDPATEKLYTMPVNGEILKDFSLNTLQYSATYGDMRIHNAVDISCKDGTLVSACSDGKVQAIEQSAALGQVVTIDHGDGLVIKYASLKNLTVKNGDKVKTGDTIGAVSTVPNECADQSHLHIEAYKNGKDISILTLFE